MRKKGIILLLGLIAAGVYLLLAHLFPKNASFLPFLLILILLDLYLWLSVKKTIWNLKPAAGYTLMGLYWLPVVLFASSLFTALAVPFAAWNIPMRTYLMGVIGIIYLSKLLPILFLLLADLLRIIRFIYEKLTGSGASLSSIRRMKALLLTGWTGGVLFFILLILGITLWGYDFKVRTTEIALPELPASFDGMKVVLISDLHLGSWARKAKLAEAVALINGERPDLVFFTGDMVNYTSVEVRDFESILAGIRAREGVFCIMGNHDYGDYVDWDDPDQKRSNFLDLCRFYEQMHWNLLLNDHVILRRGTDSIALIGVENWGESSRFQRLGDLAAAEKGVESMPVKLLLSHDPSHWDSIVSRLYKNIDITFSGHTHGFQFGIETEGWHWSPFEEISRYWIGLYRNPETIDTPQYLYVNRGLGSIGYPGRIGILPEITVVILRKK